MPSINLEPALKYLERLTDKVGVIEHAKYHFPRKSEGYSLDDNARAYQVMLRLGKPGRVYLKFIENAFSDGIFHNDLDYSGRWQDQPGKGEWFGRAVSCLGEGTKKGFEGEQTTCRQLTRQILKKGINVDSIRNKSQVILGLSWYGEGKSILNDLANNLVKAFLKNSDSEWKWYENGLFYDNGILPTALFRAYFVLGNKLHLKIARESLDFLITRCYNPNQGCFTFPGTNGWWKRSKPWELFDQQPIEAGSLVEACVEGFKTTGDLQYLKWARLAWEWYGGKNLVKLSLVDNETGGIRDGLHEDRYNSNEGAEAVLSYLLAGIALKELQ